MTQLIICCYIINNQYVHLKTFTLNAFFQDSDIHYGLDFIDLSSSQERESLEIYNIIGQTML